MMKVKIKPLSTLSDIGDVSINLIIFFAFRKERKY